MKPVSRLENVTWKGVRPNASHNSIHSYERIKHEENYSNHFQAELNLPADTIIEVHSKSRNLKVPDYLTPKLSTKHVSSKTKIHKKKIKFLSFQKLTEAKDLPIKYKRSVAKFVQSRAERHKFHSDWACLIINEAAIRQVCHHCICLIRCDSSIEKEPKKVFFAWTQLALIQSILLWKKSQY